MPKEAILTAIFLVTAIMTVHMAVTFATVRVAHVVVAFEFIAAAAFAGV